MSEANYLQEKGWAQDDYLAFWANQARSLTWQRPFTRILEGDFSSGTIKWFSDGQVNACYNCLDKNIEEGRGDKLAYVYQSEDGTVKKSITYRQLLDKVSVICHILAQHGAKKGDRVTIYMPMGLEVVAIMLACARMGLVHSVVFAGFSAHALAARILDGQCHFLFTANSFQRGGKKIPLYDIVCSALEDPQVSECVQKIFVHAHDTVSDFTLRYKHEDLGHWEKKCSGRPLYPAETCGAEDPLFILYTSGSTGRPKGLLHTTGGYLTQVAYTFKRVFELRPEEMYWCTADVGWITGHSYIVYGPLINGATSLIFEGAPSVPDWGRFWQLCEEYKVNVFYTAPTAIRSFMAQGEQWVNKYNMQHLRLLGTVGEPINPEAWRWYHKVVGQQRCGIIDTWWQTETGAMMMTPIPDVHQPAKPGFATSTLPGLFVDVVDDKGQTVPPQQQGSLVITRPWPAQARTIYGDHGRFIETYFKHFPGFYFTGDGSFRDEEGHIKITGRIDDVVNIAGHRLGTAEVESALVNHPLVVEAAVVGIPDDIKGEAIVAYVRLATQSYQQLGKDEEKYFSLEQELSKFVTTEIGNFARPKQVLIVGDLPKTRSGKIMRRILRKLACHETEQLGDLSTLAIPEVITDIAESIKNRPALKIR